MVPYKAKASSTDVNSIRNGSFTYVNREGRVENFVPPNFNLNPDMCAMYARLSAERLFGKKYNRSDAWNLKYVNTTTEPLANLSNAEIGDMITFYSPSSKYNTRGQENRDRYGNMRDATHVGLLVDFDYNKRPIIAHQFHSDIEVGFLRDIEEKRRIKHKEIIRTRN